MNKRYRLGEIEEAVSEMEELIGLEDDIAEIDDDFQIVVSGWSVYVESLNLTLRQKHALTVFSIASFFIKVQQNRIFVLLSEMPEAFQNFN